MQCKCNATRGSWLSAAMSCYLLVVETWERGGGCVMWLDPEWLGQPRAEWRVRCQDNDCNDWGGQTVHIRPIRGSWWTSMTNQKLGKSAHRDSLTQKEAKQDNTQEVFDNLCECKVQAMIFLCFRTLEDLSNVFAQIYGHWTAGSETESQPSHSECNIWSELGMFREMESVS